MTVDQHLSLVHDDGPFSYVFERIAARVGDRAAVVDADGSTVSWSEFVQNSNRIAAHLLDRGLGRGDSIAVFMRNSSAFLETYAASFRAGFVPVNINYRYGAEETDYLLADSGARAVVYHAAFRDVIETVRATASDDVVWIEVPDGTAGSAPEWATDHRAIAATDNSAEESAALSNSAPSGDVPILLYTGGTTGMPKGVIWRQRDLFEILLAKGNPWRDLPAPESLDHLVDVATSRPGPVDVAACPYMHATGLFNQLITLAAGGTSVVVPGESFDAHVLLTTAARAGATLLVIVGDAMARPIVDALDAIGDRLDLESLVAVVSSGATFSRVVKERLLEHLPDISIVDAFGSSEASGIGINISTRGDVRDTADFVLGPQVRVITDDGEFLAPGEAGEGLVALGGVLPVGYHNDPDKSASTFREIDGVRYGIPGDFARVDADGTLHLLGRGSSCINSGGEKIYPEEVDEVVRRHPAVADAACIGVPDDRFGEAVAAIVSCREGASIDLETLRTHVKSQLAGYKAPRRLIVVDEVLRSPSGKLDHRWLRATAGD
ncbi:MAG: AMP-binding protein [Ilumatobacteraceae bacterium]|nr:AMP-binding protein [Ilumatobacteraceae bacterium]